MALPGEAGISLISFIFGCSVFLVSNLFYLNSIFQSIWESLWIPIYLLFGIAVFSGLKTLYVKDRDFAVAIRGGLLGSAFSLGLILSSLYSLSWQHFGWYLTCLSVFHWSEYFTTAVTNPKSLTIDSYLLDHSREYKLAAIASWAEFCLEWLLIPGLKQFRYVSMVGVLLVMGGEVVRKGSMVTASTNFNHYVQYVKRPDHQLVTHGIYSLCRHPSYVGWFIWSIGTQIILCNPVCLIGYTIISWRFFKERILEEEIYLLNFFGEEYVDYQQRSLKILLCYISSETSFQDISDDMSQDRIFHKLKERIRDKHLKYLRCRTIFDKTVP